MVEENNNNKDLDEIEAELEKELNLQNITSFPNNKKIKPEKKIKNLNGSKDTGSLNTINLTNKSPTINNNNILQYYPDNFGYKRSTTIVPNYTNQNDNLNSERRSLKYDVNRIHTLNNNLTSSVTKISKTETKINKNMPSLGLEQIKFPNNINAVLQCLAHLPELAEGILELGYKEKYFKENENVELSRNFATLVNNIFFPMKFNNNSKVFCPKNFVGSFIQMCPLINNKSPHFYFSTNEMVKFILDTFHNELNIKKSNCESDLKEKKEIDISNEKEVLLQFLTKFTNSNNSLISKLFYGLTKSKYICNKCWSIKYNFDYYNYLYFDLPKIKKFIKESKLNTRNDGYLTLYDCLDYQRREINIPSLFKEIKSSILEKFGINPQFGKAYCTKCKLNTKSSLYNYLYSSNTILPIIFERGNDDNYFMQEIKFPDELNLENYVEFNKSVKKYYLCGVIANFGKNNKYGKFIAYCRMSQNDKWYSYFNEKIKVCSLKDVCKEEIPYMLIYHKA